VREKRDVPTKSLRAEIEEKQKRAIEIRDREINNNPLLARLMSSRAPVANLPVCPEIDSPQPGVDYPWYCQLESFELFSLNKHTSLYKGLILDYQPP
jgi:hypothetical protein